MHYLWVIDVGAEEREVDNEKLIRYEVFMDWLYLVQYDPGTSTMFIELIGPEIYPPQTNYHSKYRSPQEKAKAVDYHCMPAKIRKSDGTWW